MSLLNNIEVKDETAILEHVRAFLRKEARRLVADDPNRIGKQFAQVEFVPIEGVFAVGLSATKIDYV